MLALSKPIASEELETLLHKVYLHDVHPDAAKLTIARFIVELTQAVRAEERERWAKAFDTRSERAPNHSASAAWEDAATMLRVSNGEEG